MRVTRSATLLSRQKERLEIVLMPEEILIRIWSFLDFDTLQKICVLVSKSWFDKIRNSMKLSGEFYLNAYENYYHRPGQKFVPSIGIIEKTMWADRAVFGSMYLHTEHFCNFTRVSYL